MPAVTGPEADALNLAKQDEKFKKRVNRGKDEAKKAVEA